MKKCIISTDLHSAWGVIQMYDLMVPLNGMHFCFIWFTMGAIG